MSKISAIMYAQLRRDDNDICRNRGNATVVCEANSNYNNDKYAINRDSKSDGYFRRTKKCG